MAKTPDLKLTRIGVLISYNPGRKSLQTWHDCECTIRDGKIEEIGNDLPKADTTLDCNGKLVTPGFVDSHTHPVFLFGREVEFLMRLTGATYQEIAESGGGIQSSIDGVRKTNESDLVKAVSRRMDRFLRLGTTTVEGKSGYGLSTESELKSLAVLKTVNANHPIDIIPTFLGAHAVPSEYKDDPDAYVDLICNKMLPAVARQGIARYCDVFCENGYFSVGQSRQILKKAKSLGLGIRLHADEFADSGAAGLAGELGVVSADHLMAVSVDGIKAMADSGVIATLLPGTTFFLGSSTYAPYLQLADAGIDVALATDFNPGSCHIQSMPLIIALACIYMKMPVEEAFIASTWMGAKALGIENETGHITVGANADVIVWDLDELVEIPYNAGDVPIRSVLKSGKIVYQSSG